MPERELPHEVEYIGCGGVIDYTDKKGTRCRAVRTDAYQWTVFWVGDGVIDFYTEFTDRALAQDLGRRKYTIVAPGL